jgi:hypothetical protein
MSGFTDVIQRQKRISGVSYIYLPSVPRREPWVLTTYFIPLPAQMGVVMVGVPLGCASLHLSIVHGALT